MSLKLVIHRFVGNDMLKEISFEEASKLLEEGKIENMVYVYHNGMTSPVKETDTLWNLEYHDDGCGDFAIKEE